MVKFLVTLDDELADLLKKDAASNGRSAAGQLRQMLKLCFEYGGYTALEEALIGATHIHADKK